MDETSSITFIQQIFGKGTDDHPQAINFLQMHKRIREQILLTGESKELSTLKWGRTVAQP